MNPTLQEMREDDLRCYTQQECEAWLNGRQRQMPDEVYGLHREQIRFPSEPYKMFGLARWIATSLGERLPVLLWITGWSTGSIVENWHLYYKLRQTYHDYRLLDEAPGHLFLEYEAEDLTSFLQVAMLNDWSGYVLTQLDEVNVLFDDDFMYFDANREENLSRVRKFFGSDKTA